MGAYDDIDLALAGGGAEAALAIARGRPDAARYLAARLLESGHAQASLRALEGADPADAATAFLRGHARLRLEDFPAAAADFAAAVAARPGWAQAWAGAGLAAHRNGDRDTAESAYARALALTPDDAATSVNRAVLLDEMGRTDEAAEAWRVASKLAPDDPRVAYDAGNAFARAGDAAGAEERYRAALARAPGLQDARLNLGNLLAARRRLAEAAELFETLLAAEPSRREAWRSLAAVRLELMDDARAERAARDGLARFPGDAELALALASVSARTGRLDEAKAGYAGLLETPETRARARMGLAGVLYDLGRADEACALAEAAFAEAPDDVLLGNNLALYAQYAPGRDGPARLALARAVGRAIEAAAPAAPAFVARGRGARLRLGFVSGDLHTHPVGLYLVPILEGLDRNRVETICYANGPGDDATTARLRAAAGTWRHVASLDDAACLDAIRADAPDALFEMSGHTPRNRLGVFAARAARTQMAWAGPCAPAGVANLDFMLADSWMIPPESGGDFGERVVRMEGTCLPFFDPFGDLPAPGARPPGPIRFGSYNNAAKLSPDTLAAWGEILARVPGATLTLRHRQYGIPEAADDLAARFAALGVDRARLVFAPAADRRSLIASYAGIDIGLDPFPFSGGVTTLEALWMGVPVVTLASRRAIGRLGVSILSALGRPEWIAEDVAGYVARAVDLAKDRARLAALQGVLRGELQASPIFDARGRAASFLDAVESVL